MSHTVFITLLVIGCGPFLIIATWLAVQEWQWRHDARRRARRLRQRRLNAYTTERVPW